MGVATTRTKFVKPRLGETLRPVGSTNDSIGPPADPASVIVEPFEMPSWARGVLIILDITMPVMDGVAMLTKLKEDPASSSIPVIMLTAESARENVAQIAKLGVQDYLTKPFKEDQLIEKVSQVVSLQKKAA